MAKKAHTKKKDSKKSTQAHVMGVFGDPKKVVRELSRNSMAVQSLPPHLQKRLLKALGNLPEEQKVEALQVLQKEKSAYVDLAAKNHAAGEHMNSRLKEIQKNYTKKKHELLEKHERAQAEENVDTFLNE